MKMLAQVAVGYTFGFVCGNISDTFISGAFAGVLTLWINLAIGGQLKVEPSMPRSSGEGRVG